jgi:PKD repeat protein
VLKYYILSFISISLLFACRKKEEEKPHPVITYSFSNNKGSIPVTVHFNALMLNSSTVSWDFGDGQTGTGSNTSHTYTTSGFFNVVAKTTNSEGEVASAEGHVDVSPFTKMVIEKITVIVPGKKNDTTAWDTDGSNADLYCDVYNSSGTNLTAASSPYTLNSSSAVCEYSPGITITDFYNNFKVQIMDYDLGSGSEFITAFYIRPGDYIPSSPSSVRAISQSNGASSINVKLAWY